jgi:hypothetical protein
MTIAQHAKVTSATGTNEVTLSDAGAATGNAAVESYNLAAGANTFTTDNVGQTVVGNTGNDDITGGSGDDIFTGGFGVDTIKLSAGGADTVVFTAESVGTEATSDTIIDFNGGTGTDADKLDFTTAMSDTIDENSLQVHKAEGEAIAGEVIAFDSLPGANPSDIEFFFDFGSINGLLQDANKSEAIFILAESRDAGSDSNIWHWTDGRDGQANDNAVQAEELDKLGTLQSFDQADLTSLVQANLITG